MADQVIVERLQDQKAYSVYYGAARHGRFARVFLWGCLDGGDVPWQSARKNATAYAKELKQRLSR